MLRIITKYLKEMIHFNIELLSKVREDYTTVTHRIISLVVCVPTFKTASGCDRRNILYFVVIGFVLRAVFSILLPRDTVFL